MPSEDELAQTATVPASPVAHAAGVRTVLGRYRIEATLGQGGMGVVHAAFDPELERKIALKVLRHAGSADARARLLREARAMAKLSHPHVITVFDVGSAEGEDFVAMELVDGQTLGEWVRDHHPRPRQILAAFVAAGRGLAAAHRAGLVHRDFKPSNVLRSRDGKIVVTDFGLARETGGADAVAVGASAAGLTTTRTETGAILGTPAYMAPEQWTGGEVTPATDQFAFCVALWEALAGERPYRGNTAEELRTGVLGGPAELAAEAIPRPLRSVLRRGLEADAAGRWPSMDALLAALDSYLGRRRRWLVYGGGLAVIATIVAVYAVGRSRASAGADGCQAPVLDPRSVPVAQLAARDAGAGELVRGDLARWASVRERTCAAPAVERSPRLACLDTTLARLAATVRAVVADPARLDADGLAIALVDPALCDRPSPPRVTPMTPELAAAFALRRHARAGAAPTASERALADRAQEPCAHATALLGRIECFDERDLPANANTVFRDMTAAMALMPRCDDDAIKTEFALGQAELRGATDVEDGEAAVSAFPQDDMRGQVEAIRARRAAASERWADALAANERALELFGRRHRTGDELSAVQAAAHSLIAIGGAAELARAQALYARWIPIARAFGPRRSTLELDALHLRWGLGDVAGADAAIEEMRARGRLTDFTPPYSMGPEHDVAGVVVDESGAPVAGAQVAAGFFLIGDSASIASPAHTPLQRGATTAADGTFRIAGAHGFIRAQLGDRRSSAVPVADHVKVVLLETGTIAGTVALGGLPAHRASVIARSETGESSVVMIAPIAKDGAFQLTGVPRGKIALAVTTSSSYELGGRIQRVVVGSAPVTVALSASQQRLYVIGHSRDLTPPEGALVWLFADTDPGPAPTLKTLKTRTTVRSGLFGQAGDLKQLPPELTGKVQHDDIVVTIRDRPEGAVLACGIGFAIAQFTSAPTSVELGNLLADMPLACVHVTPEQSSAVIELPPMRKLTP
jgi:predicted Ser/Thr protein kinase